LEKSLNNLIKNNTIGFEKLPKGLKLIIPNSFLFQSARATILAENRNIIDSIALAIKDLDMQIQVDGHTDAVPIKSFTYESNWQLSAARAVNIVQMLIESGVPAHNLVVRAYGEQRPITDNTTEKSREKNRRVEIIITPKDDNVATTADEKNISDKNNSK
jgi:chemotaxis protein MotB